jgi:hypothetical protein
MSISIEWRERPDGEWRFADGYSSLDAAKSACCDCRKIGNRRAPVTRRDMDFRIYSNDRLYLVNAVNSSWRLRWIPGNGQSRAEQASSSLQRGRHETQA